MLNTVFSQSTPLFSCRLKEEPRSAPKKERREKEDRQRERRRRERPQTIQSHSIFEQRPADTFRKTGKACKIFHTIIVLGLRDSISESSSYDFILQEVGGPQI